MDAKVDHSFYKQVKAKFHSVEKGTIIFISLSSDNVDDLMPISFKRDQLDDYDIVLKDHVIECKPYAILDHEDGEPIFYFRNRYFVQKESLRTGNILRFIQKDFVKIDWENELIRKELAQLGELLTGNSKAS